MGGKMSLRLVVISAAALVSYDAGAAEMCGRSFVAFEKFYAALAEEQTHQMRGGGPHDAAFIDGQGAMWLFAKESHPAFPAVACAPLVRKGAPPEIQRHFWCRGPGGGACDSFLKDFPAVNGLTGGFEWK